MSMTSGGRVQSPTTPAQYVSPRVAYSMPVVPPNVLPMSARSTFGDPSGARVLPSSLLTRPTRATISDTASARVVPTLSSTTGKLPMPRFLASEQRAPSSAPASPVRSRLLDGVESVSHAPSTGSTRWARVLKSDLGSPSTAYPLRSDLGPSFLARSLPLHGLSNGEGPSRINSYSANTPSVSISPPRMIAVETTPTRSASSSCPMPSAHRLAAPVELVARYSSLRPQLSATPPKVFAASGGRVEAAPTPWRLKLGAEVPNFFCTTTAGDFMFYDYVSVGPQYTLLFSHPADFTPVCTTELGRCEQLIAEFEARGVQLIGLSCDPVTAHLGWSTDILAREQIHRADGKLSFPLIADANRKIAGTLGMLDPEEMGADGIPLPARSLMVIDQQRKVKLAIVYPATTGRNFDEVLRVIDSLILTREKSLATPADWRPGERCIVAPSVPTALAEQLFDDLIVEPLPSGKPYLRYVNCPPATQNGSASKTVTSGVGISVHDDTRDAVHDAIQTALQDIRNPAMVFAACTVDRIVEEVQATFAEFLPGVPLHGITSSQTLLHPTGSYAKGVGCLILDAPRGSFASAFADDVVEAAHLLREQMPMPQAIIMSTVPGSEDFAIETLIEFFGVPIYGGTAADNEVNGSWQVFGSDRCSKVGISLVGVGPGIHMGASMIAPYLPTNCSARITRAEGRRVFEINNIPAADWVYEWLGDSVQDAYLNGGLILPQTAQMPIGFPLPSGNYQSAHLAALGGPEKWVDFFTPVVEGQEIVIMDSGDGPTTGYAQTFADAYEMAIMNGQLSNPKAGILIFCGGMAIATGEQLNYGLVNGLQSAHDVPILGMTCFGEQSYAPEDNVNLHRNLSLGLLLFE